VSAFVRRRRPPSGAPSGERSRSAGVLVAITLLALGGCATDRASERSRTATMLSEKLARVRAPSSSAGKAGAGPALDGTVPGAKRRVRPLAAAPRAPRPRPLDPVPPLYVPTPRDLPLQPILVGRRAASHRDLSPRPSPLRRDPLADDPLRRIDPLTGRDPLGRPDPSGGVDLGSGGFQGR